MLPRRPTRIVVKVQSACNNATRKLTHTPRGEHSLAIVSPVVTIWLYAVCVTTEHIPVGVVLWVVFNSRESRVYANRASSTMHTHRDTQYLVGWWTSYEVAGLLPDVNRLPWQQQRVVSNGKDKSLLACDAHQRIIFTYAISSRRKLMRCVSLINVALASKNTIQCEFKTQIIWIFRKTSKQNIPFYLYWHIPIKLNYAENCKTFQQLSIY